MKQLLMRWDASETESIPVPEGYHLVQFRRGGVEGMSVQQFRDGYLKTIAPARAVEDWEFPWLYEDQRIPDDGFFVIVSHQEDRIVATASVQLGEYKPGTATLHMVCTDPAHRGKRLGSIVTAAAMQYVYRHGIRVMYLETDEQRIPALKIYLNLGFRPVFHEADMEECWAGVFKTLEVTQMEVYDTNEQKRLVHAPALKRAAFSKGTKIESNTYYLAQEKRYDIYLSDTTRSYELEYRAHTTSAGEYLDIAFLLKDLENVVLDFGGATVVLHGRIQPFMVDNCKNLTIQNVKIDYDRPFYTQATVSACTESQMRLRFDEGFPCRVDPEHQGLVACSETWEYRMNRNDCLLWMYDMEDQENHNIILALFGTDIYPKKNPPLPIRQILVEQDGEDVVFHGSFPEDWQGRSGQKLLITHEPRDKSSIQTVGGENITLENVQIISGSAMALICMHTKNITVDHFDFFSNHAGNGRVVTNNADAIHMFNCYGKVQIRNCTMEGLLDDTVNIHGNFLAVTETLPDGIWCNPDIYGKSYAIKLFMPGDRVAFYNGSTREKKAEATVTALIGDPATGGHTMRIRETEIISSLCPGDVIENLSGNPEVLIENCVFRRFRGTMRLQSGGKTVVRNCRFENRGDSLLITGDTVYWYESGPVQDLTVEDCYFAHADLGYRIKNETQVTYTEKEPFYHRGVKVKNCFFDGPLACRFDHVDDITIFGNKTSADHLAVSLTDCGSHKIEDAQLV